MWRRFLGTLCISKHSALSQTNSLIKFSFTLLGDEEKLIHSMLFYIIFTCVRTIILQLRCTIASKINVTHLKVSDCQKNCS